MAKYIAAARVAVSAAMQEEHRLFEKLQKAEQEHAAAKATVAKHVKKLEDACKEQGVKVGW